MSAFRVVPYPHAPNEDGRPWRDSILLGGGWPAWGRRLLSSEVRGSLSPWGATPGAVLYANRAMAYNRYLLLPVLCPRGWRSWSVFSRCGSISRWLNGYKPGQCYVGDRPLPMQYAPTSLHVGDGSKGTAGPLQFRTSDVAGVARMRLSTTTALQRLQLWISPRGLLLKPFPKKGNCRATVIIARWPPLTLQIRRHLT